MNSPLFLLIITWLDPIITTDQENVFDSSQNRVFKTYEALNSTETILVTVIYLVIKV